MTEYPVREAAYPIDEAERVCELRTLDTHAPELDAAFAQAARLAATVVPGAAAAVTVIEEDRQIARARTADHVLDMPRRHAFCAHTILSDAVLWIEDARLDDRFFDNPLVTAPGGLRFYAGAPIVVGGCRIGAVIAYAGEPRAFDADAAAGLVDLAALLAGRLELHRSRRSLATEAAARARAERERDVMFAAPVALVLLDTEARVIGRSALWAEEFLADPHVGVVGRRIGDVVRSSPISHELFTRALAGEAARGTTSCELPSRPPRHRTFEARPWRDTQGRIVGVSMTSFDVHELVLARLELESYERRLKAALEGSGTVAYEAEPESGRLVVDGPFERLFGKGCGTHAFEGDLFGAVSPLDRERVRAGWRIARAEGRALRDEYRVTRRDGVERWVAGSIELRSGPGEPLRFGGMLHDITALKHAQIAFEQAAHAAEGANRAKTEFLANMSHELRTPLNGVVGVTSALARTPLDAAQREMVELVETSARSLERLLTDVLDLARVEADGFQLNAEPTDLADFVRGVATLFKWRARDQGLAFVWNVDPTLAGEWSCDGARVRQILNNLLANALKFTERGGVEIRVRPVDDTGVAFDVVDTGIGFSAAVAARLFERFEQADGSITRRYGGSGLGLAISRSLAQRMGGSLTTMSEPGVGSTFTLTLPLRRALPDASNRPPDGDGVRAAKDDIERAGPLDVLLAEDHPVNRKVIQLILAAIDVRLVSVENGAEAVERAAAQRFDLVLMDVQMPVMDGLTAIRTIRRHEADRGLPHTPIMTLTANALPEHVLASAEAGADAHLTKPVNAETLLAAVRRMTAPAFAAHALAANAA